ncbi:MAG: exodeoxyribonuclease VII small subunit [Propionibacteriaceae bacterium]
MSEQPTTPDSDRTAQAAADAELSYEQAKEELQLVVQRLESGGAPLDESLALWERGERLANRCQGWLDGAKAKIDAAREQAHGEE